MDVGCVFRGSPLSANGSSLNFIDDALGEIGLSLWVQAGGGFHQSGIGECWGAIVGGLDMGGCEDSVCALHFFYYNSF